MGKMIELTASDGHKLSAYRAEPVVKPKGGLIVVQEIFGVNSHIRSVADGYAADGYLAIAPALFDRIQRGYEPATRRRKSRRALARCRRSISTTR
jgi:carboxymethylenebutenolidase